jgi:3-oxoadipate CoA-transferase beta subunit
MDSITNSRPGSGSPGSGSPGSGSPGSGSTAVEHAERGPLSTDELAAVIGRDIPDGAYVNLGIGQPTKIADHLPTDAAGHPTAILHTENGMLGMGPAAVGDAVDPDLTNAGKVPVTELPGAAYFHHADSFAMMRGGHLDVCVLGAYQVSAAGDLANWHTGKPDDIPAVGGAMDLAIGAKDVYVMMTLFTKKGDAKLVAECSYPLTGVACVSRVYTDYAVFDIQPDGVHVLSTYGITLAGLRDRVPVKLLG